MPFMGMLQTILLRIQSMVWISRRLPRIAGSVSAVFCFILLAIAAAPVSAQVTLPCLFADHMVLQRANHVPVWGRASAGENVQVTLGTAQGEAVADQDGRWRAYLDLAKQGNGPFQLVIQAKNRISISDVLVGEVWLAGGQSNMEVGLAGTIGYAKEVAASENPNLREFKVKKAGSAIPEDNCTGAWVAASPQTSGNFSAVGYYFGSTLQRSLKVPVGVINSSYGGSPLETWMSPELLQQFPSIKENAQQLMQDSASYPERVKQYHLDYDAWQAKYHREDKPLKSNATPPDMSPDHTAKIVLPGDITGGDPTLANGGAAWISRTVELPEISAGVTIKFHEGKIRDFDQLYWNDVRVGYTTATESNSIHSSNRNEEARRYDIPGGLVKAGKNRVTIRVFNPVAPPQMVEIPRIDSGDIPLDGPWQMKIDFVEPEIDAVGRSTFPHIPADAPADGFVPTRLFNAMIHPLIPYSMRGIIWYQGESNVGRGFEYRTTFPALIQDWRNQWGLGAIPFYFCQIANFQAHPTQPQESKMAELRESQSLALALPNTGQAVTIDLGEESDIHFRDKQSVGLRLARIAIAKTYHGHVPWSGPVYDHMKIEGSAIRIFFDHADGGLVGHTIPATYKQRSSFDKSVPLVRPTPNSQLEGFAICGSDRKWHWANAKIDGETVVVSSPDVQKPVAVRYAWADNPITNLYNGAGLPATPFRTDDFPLITQDKHY
jgi:sialate O-acetylesterase